MPIRVCAMVWLLVGAALFAGMPAAAELVAQQRGNSCDAVWDLGQARATVIEGDVSRLLDCIDGDPRCDSDSARNGRCAIVVRACVGSTGIAGCVARPLTKPVRVGRKGRLAGFVAPAALAGPDACGAPGTIVLGLRDRRRKPSRPFLLDMRTRGAAGVGTNRVRLVCRDGVVPTTTTTTTSTTTTTVGCPARPAGVPQEMTLAVASAGSDLDYGFTGSSHNVTMVAGTMLSWCLDGCDATTNSVCSASGAVGAATKNGVTFGAPQPLVSSGVPVCLVHRFREPLHATVDLATGEIRDADLPLLTDVHVRLNDQANVCPRCLNGRCAGNSRNDGAACEVDGRVTISGTANPSYELSSDCLPGGDPVSSVALTLPLTTEIASLSGARPCPGQVADDSCVGNACGSQCSATPPPQGGIHQTCCETDPTRPCFPTRRGGTITRTGTRSILQPPWPDPTYPKGAAGGTLVASFCVPRVNDNTVDSTIGLPGPGAVMLPVTQQVDAGAP